MPLTTTPTAYVPFAVFGIVTLRLVVLALLMFFCLLGTEVHEIFLFVG